MLTDLGLETGKVCLEGFLGRVGVIKSCLQRQTPLWALELPVLVVTQTPLTTWMTKKLYD